MDWIQPVGAWQRGLLRDQPGAVPVSWAVWITGVPGSGKSAIARAAAATLAAGGEFVRILELDALRRTLTPAPIYDDTERQAVYARSWSSPARSRTPACP